MSTENKEFYNLLKTLTEEQTFPLDLFSTGEKVNCKYLTTSQLKEIIKTVVDSPLTQSAFNTTCTNIFKDSLVSKDGLVPLNVLDRLSFLLQTRINSISPIVTINKSISPVAVNFSDILSKLHSKKQEHLEKFATVSETEGKVKITYGVALLDAELQLNEEIYKDLKVNVNDAEEMKNLLGESFINEIGKCIQSITIGENTLDLSKISFKERLQAIGSLPASLIQKVIGYIEQYKDVVDDCLTIDNNLITIDASLFSVK